MSAKVKTKSKLRIWLGRIAGVVISLTVIALIGILIMVFINNFTGKENSIFGYRIVYILTDSMSPELEQGTTILTKECTADELVLGDYVTFVAASGLLEGHNVTHEVVELPYLNTEDDKWYISTRGIKEGAPIDDPVPVENVQAKFVAKLPIITLIVKLLKNPWGYVMLIALPLVAMLVFQFVRMAKVSAEDAAEKEIKSREVAMNELTEAEIAKKAVEEFILEQKAKAAAESAQKEASKDNIEQEPPSEDGDSSIN